MQQFCPRQVSSLQCSTSQVAGTLAPCHRPARHRLHKVNSLPSSQRASQPQQVDTPPRLNHSWAASLHAATRGHSRCRTAAGYASPGIPAEVPGQKACSGLPTGALPEGVQLQVKGEEEGGGIDFDEAQNLLRVPLSALGPEGRRSKIVLFTCDVCGGRTGRAVNPIAWENGLVFGQCSHCDKWHTLSAKNKKIFEEIRYNEQEPTQPLQQDTPSAAAAEAA